MVTIIKRSTREQWLKEREGKMTATRIAKLANGGAAARVAVAADMDGAHKDISHLPHVAWGVEREPHIIEHLNFMYGIEANSDLWVEGSNAATPDGFKRDGDRLILAEVKTSVKPLGGNPEELRSIRPEYYDQVCWAAGVCGASETVFAYEVHENFVPTAIEAFTIPFDAARFEELKAVATDFAMWRRSGETVGEYDAFMANYSMLETEIRELTARRDQLVHDFKTQAEHAELAADYMTTTEPKQQTLRITLK